MNYADKSLLWVVIFFLGTFNCLAQKDTRILLQNATIIDGRADVTPYKGSVFIENGVIKQISKNDIPVSNDVIKIPCTNKYIVPGLFDAHIHLATGDLSDLKKARAATDKILANMLKHGITTVRDMAGHAPYLADYKWEIKGGVKIGPDIYYAAQFAGPEYFEMFSIGARKKIGVSPWERAITDTTDILKAVQEAKAAGVTAIKTYSDISRALLQRVVDAARQEGVLVWSHATIYPIRPSDAVDLSVHSISHAADVIFEQIPADSLTVNYAWQRVYEGMKVDADQLKPLFSKMKRNNVFFDPTVFHATSNDLNYSTEILKMAHDAGVQIVAGTDWIYPEGNGMVPLYNEAELYHTKGGMSIPEVLQTLTYNAAMVTGLKDRGYLATGLRADVLVLDKDPFIDLKSLFEPGVVIQSGKIIK